MAAKKKARKKKTRSSTRELRETERGLSAFKRLSAEDRLKVGFRSGGMLKRPAKHRVARATKEIAGRPGAFTTRKGGSVRIAKNKKRKR